MTCSASWNTCARKWTHCRNLDHLSAPAWMVACARKCADMDWSMQREFIPAQSATSGVQNGRISPFFDRPFDGTLSLDESPRCRQAGPFRGSLKLHKAPGPDHRAIREIPDAEAKCLPQRNTALPSFPMSWVVFPTAPAISSFRYSRDTPPVHKAASASASPACVPRHWIARSDI